MKSGRKNIHQLYFSNENLARFTDLASTLNNHLQVKNHPMMLGFKTDIFFYKAQLETCWASFLVIPSLIHSQQGKLNPVTHSGKRFSKRNWITIDCQPMKFSLHTMGL